jgi:hypothetical protein
MLGFAAPEAEAKLVQAWRRVWERIPLEQALELLEYWCMQEGSGGLSAPRIAVTPYHWDNRQELATCLCGGAEILFWQAAIDLEPPESLDYIVARILAQALQLQRASFGDPFRPGRRKEDGAGDPASEWGFSADALLADRDRLQAGPPGSAAYRAWRCPAGVPGPEALSARFHEPIWPADRARHRAEVEADRARQRAEVAPDRSRLHAKPEKVSPCEWDLLRAVLKELSPAERAQVRAELKALERGRG